MSNPDDLTAALARLGVLGERAGVDIRPVLLRVVVDLFMSKPHHAPDELRTFEAMVGPLLDHTDPETRRVVALKLARHAETPVALLDRLIDEQNLIDAEAYRLAPMEQATLLAAAKQGPVSIAAMIAHRSDLSPAVVRTLAERPEPRVGVALAANKDAALDRLSLAALVRRARTDRELAECLAERAVNPVDLAPLFTLLSPAHRRRIVDAIRRLHLGRRQWGRMDSGTAETLQRLDRLALCGEWEGFDHLLCATLACDERILRPLLHDGTGDVLALALAAAGASVEMAARAFILGDPTIGRSVASVRRLTGMVETIAPAAARRLIDAMVSGTAEEQHRPLPALKPATTARRGEFAAEAPVAAPRRESVAAPLRRRNA